MIFRAIRPARLAAAALLTATSAWAAKPALVVTTTMLATAVHDLAGDLVTVHTLMPGGSCPGSFDLTPEDARIMAGAALFLRHEFQGALDRQARAAGLAADAIAVVPSGGSLTIPPVYAAWCGALAPRLTRLLPGSAHAALDARLHAIVARAPEAEKAALARLAGLKGRPVLVAHFQADFARWAGLAPAAVYPPGEDPPAGPLAAAVNEASRGGAVAVVGNLQNGRRGPEALGEALHVPGIMLSNFPATGDAGAYWRLLDANVQALLDGLKP